VDWKLPDFGKNFDVKKGAVSPKFNLVDKSFSCCLKLGKTFIEMDFGLPKYINVGAL
jgi:hypothetical protein